MNEKYLLIRKEFVDSAEGTHTEKFSSSISEAIQEILGNTLLEDGTIPIYKEDIPYISQQYYLLITNKDYISDSNDLIRFCKEEFPLNSCETGTYIEFCKKYNISFKVIVNLAGT